VNQTSILIAEDNIALATLLMKSLRSEGHVVEMAHDGQKALQLLSGGTFDLLVLDLDLPILRGPEVLARLRAKNRDIPVLILTGIDRVEDRVARLDDGADDYLMKPVSLAELSARVRALLRRTSKTEETTLRVADLELNRLQRKVRRGDKVIELTSKEFSLLEYFMRNAGRHITRSMLIEDVWSLSSEAVTNVVDVYVNYLRKKIDDGASIRLINTVRGVGFCFGPVDAPATAEANGSHPIA